MASWQLVDISRTKLTINEPWLWNDILSLHLPCHQRFQIPHIKNPRVLNLNQHYFRDIFALFPYILTSFFEKYQWISWKLFFDDRSYPMQETGHCYILLKDMPTIQSIDINHHTESAVNASSLEECNFQKIVQIYTLSDSEVQIRIPAGQIRGIQPNVSNKNHHHDRLYFEWRWSTTGRPHSWIVIHLRHGQVRQRETIVWWILSRERTTVT